MAGLMAFTVTAFSGCGEELDKPTNITVSEDYKITWDKVEDARSYLVSIKDCDTGETTETATRKPSMSLSRLEEGDYEIRVKAISGDKSFDNSGWSVVIPFTKYPETGCVYTLINNNTEYAITRVGTAAGELVIEDYYRGKPVTEISDEAFKASSRLTSVVIGSKVRTIGEEAFMNCTNLTSVTFSSDSLQTVGNSAFQGCSSLLSISIPDNVSVISEEMFAYCKKLETVEIGSSVTTIEYGAFSDCFALRELTLPDSVESIDSYAFSKNTALSSVSFGSGVETIGDYAFYGCEGLKTVTFSGGDDVLTLGTGVFSECISLNNVVLPENLTSIGNFAFYMGASLDTISIPDSVYHVGRSAFNATKLYVDAVDAGETFVYADDWLVGTSAEKMKTVTAITADILRSDVRGIAAYTFYRNETLTRVILPDSLKYIDNCSFAYIETLSVMRTFTGTNGVVRIGRDAFRGDKVLSQVTLGEGIETIESGAFQGCVLLNNNALAGNSLIPESVKEIGKNVFKDTAMWTNAAGAAVYAGNWLVGYNGEDAKEITIATDTVGVANYALEAQASLHTVKGLENVKYLGEGAFYECSSLATLSLNRNLKEIKDYTFYGCTELYKITLPARLEKIGRSAFYQCEKLNAIDLSSCEVSEIGPYAFFKCSNLQTVDLGDSLEAIEDCAFYKCITLKELTLPDTVRTIGVRAFYKCEALETLNLSENTESIGEYAFYSCAALKSLSLPDSVKTVGKGAFYNCSAVEKLELGNKVETIGDYAFYGFEKVSALKIPASVGSIGKFAFKGWASLETLVLSGDISFVNDYAFYGCKALTIYTDMKAPTDGAEAIPDAWSLRWNIAKRPVVWGCTFSEDGSYVQALTVDKEMFTNSYTVLTEKVVEIGEDGTEVTTTKVVGKKFAVNDPAREGYVFLGWATSKDSATAEYTTEELASLDEGTVVYAVWEVAPEEEPEEESGTSEVPDASAEGDNSTENA